MDFQLSKTELVALKQKHYSMNKRKEADRIKAVYLLGSGWCVSDVREALLLSDDTIRDYFSCYKSSGLLGLIKNKHKGKVGQLTESEKLVLSAHLQENTYKTVQHIMSYVEAEFEVSYSESRLREILHELNFVYKKPEKVPYRIDEAAQKRFIRRYKRIKKSLNPEDGLYFMDATHPEHSVVPAYGWIKRGEKKTVKANPNPYRLNINGAINVRSLDMVVRFESRLNKETTKDFLEALRKHQPKGWIYLVLDNAGYYQSPEVHELAKAMCIRLIYLPPYSPNLNLVERIWKFYKKKILYNTYYPTLEEMKKASKRFFKEINGYHDELTTLMTDNFQKISA